VLCSRLSHVDLHSQNADRCAGGLEIFYDPRADRGGNVRPDDPFIYVGKLDHSAQVTMNWAGQVYGDDRGQVSSEAGMSDGNRSEIRCPISWSTITDDDLISSV
jgi:hypothetical protein